MAASQATTQRDKPNASGNQRTSGSSQPGGGGGGRTTARPTFEALGAFGEQLYSLADQFKAGISDARRQASQTVLRAAENLREQADQFVEERRSWATERVGFVASTAQRAAKVLRAADFDQVADYADNAAESVDSVLNYLEQADLERLTKDAADIARRNPLPVLGGAVVLGFIVGRVLKASLPEIDLGADSSDESTEDAGRFDGAGNTGDETEQSTFR